ncbi:hypothetical protein NMY22_g13415 [Coprinellus aureogranulatus]|nr:hypothetical protein NMY22_g13415 [Coprinellus aureogranulatus]
MKFPNPFYPPPAPPGFGKGKVLPEHKTYNPLSRLFFNWLTPFLSVGFSRPLEKDDFWTLPDDILAANIVDNLEKNFYARCSPEKRPLHLKDRLRKEDEIEDSGSTHGDLPEKDFKEEKAEHEHEADEKKAAQSKKSKKKKPKYTENLFAAVHQTFFRNIWVGGILRLISDTLKTTTPLVNKVLLQWLTDSYVFHQIPEAEREAAVAAGSLTRPRGIGFGIGLAVAVFAMQDDEPLDPDTHDHRVDCQDWGRLWIAPIQLAIGIGLLIGNLGYSALVGLGVLIAGFPIQVMVVRVMFKQRVKGMKFTDKRVRLTTEVLQGIRLLKYFAWESFYQKEITGLREKEIKTLKVMAVARSTMMAMMTLIPILAAVLSFITYALTDHELNIAVIFTALQLFNIIRMPLVLFPFVLTGLSDALVALGRMKAFLTAEDLPKPYDIKDNLNGVAVSANGDFTWETVGKPGDDGKKLKGAKKGAGKQAVGLPILLLVLPPPFVHRIAVLRLLDLGVIRRGPHFVQLPVVEMFRVLAAKVVCGTKRPRSPALNVLGEDGPAVIPHWSNEGVLSLDYFKLLNVRSRTGSKTGTNMGVNTVSTDC